MQLPVSGMNIVFRAPHGGDDLALLEARGSGIERGLLALQHLAEFAGAHGDPPVDISWQNLSVTDFEVALLGLRLFLLGDHVRCLFRCSAKGCGERIETEFSITAFLATIEPRMPLRVTATPDRQGWFQLATADKTLLAFRIPTVDDQLSIVRQPRTPALLAQQCVDSQRLTAKERAQIERMMEAMAPLVTRPLMGTCPACGEPVSMLLHVPTLVADELTAAAASIHDDVNAIASTYHWAETTILAMPQSRRRTYAEMIRSSQRAIS